MEEYRKKNKSSPGRQRDDMLTELRTKKPVIHCITNHVVSNFQANGLLALGASPIMADAPEEAAEVASMAGALSLNTGTLSIQSLGSMLSAGQAANRNGIPVVLDPVGAGASPFRLSAVRQLLHEVNIDIIRCNAGELAAIMGADWQAKGVDAGEGQADIARLSQQTAQAFQTVVAVTGRTDVITDGVSVTQVPFGHPMMAAVTGMGCLLSSITAAFLAVYPEKPADAASAALRFFGIAGECAGESALGPGNFQIAFLDALAAVTEQDIDTKIQEEEEAER